MEFDLTISDRNLIKIRNARFLNQFLMVLIERWGFVRFLNYVMMSIVHN